MARKSSLGPFPKTRRLSELVADSDGLVGRMRARLERLLDDKQTQTAIYFLISLPVVSRYPHPRQALRDLFGIEWQGSLASTVAGLLTEDDPASRAAQNTLDRFTSSPRFDQTALGADVDWAAWRELDGSAFCELGRLFFACLAEEHFKLECDADSAQIRMFSWEISRITQSFSARWFNKCAVGQIPDRNGVRWYLGHCLGKLDMELERELLGHVEPPPTPSRRRKVEPPSLGLGI